MLAFVTTLIVLLLLMIDGIYVAVRLPSDLENSAIELEAGIEALEDGALDSARTSFSNALGSAEAARGIAAHPSLVIASFLPGLADDAEVARRLPEVLSLTAEAGQTAVEAGTRLGGTTGEDLAQAIYRDGRVQLDTLERAEPFVTNAHRLLDNALATAIGLPEPSLGPLQDALGEVRVRLIEATDLASNGSTLLKTLPPLLGSGAPKRYLLLFQSPSEARGTGGLIGLYGILEFDKGAVSLTHVAPFAEVFRGVGPADLRALDVPTEFLERYESTLSSSGDVNRSPDFEPVSSALLQIYRRETRTNLDGVLATDPVALGELTRATGPLPAPALRTELGPENTAEVLLHDTYIAFARRTQAQNFFLARVIREFYRALGGGGINGPQLVRSFADATASQHIKIYSNIPRIQRRLAELGASGTVAGNGIQFVFHNNLGHNKIDYFLQREVDTTVEFDAQGNAHVATRIEVENRAPEAPNALTRSAIEGILPGLNRMELSILLPREARDATIELNGTDTETKTWQEAGVDALAVDVRVMPGESSEAMVTYELSNATDIATGGAFAMTLVPQAAVNHDDYSITFVAPPGFEVSDVDGGGSEASITFTGTLHRPETFAIKMDAVE